MKKIYSGEEADTELLASAIVLFNDSPEEGEELYGVIVYSKDSSRIVVEPVASIYEVSAIMENEVSKVLRIRNPKLEMSTALQDIWMRGQPMKANRRSLR